MRNLEARLVDRSVAVEQQVEVDGSRAEARPVASDATEAALDRKQALEQLAGAQRRVELGGAVEETRLVLVPDGVGLAQGRDRDDADSVLGREQPQCALDLTPWILKVRAQPDEASGHGRDCPSSVASRSYRVTRRAPQRTDRGHSPLLQLGRSGGPARASWRAGHVGTAVLPAAAGLPANARRARPGPRRPGRARAAPRRRRADLARARALAAAELDRAAPAARAQA